MHRPENRRRNDNRADRSLFILGKLKHKKRKDVSSENRLFHNAYRKTIQNVRKDISRRTDEFKAAGYERQERKIVERDQKSGYAKQKSLFSARKADYHIFHTELKNKVNGERGTDDFERESKIPFENLPAAEPLRNRAHGVQNHGKNHSCGIFFRAFFEICYFTLHFLLSSLYTKATPQAFSRP